MRGYNEIRINQATMLEAMELWLADQFKNPPKPENVSRDTSQTPSNVADQFILRISNAEPTT